MSDAPDIWIEVLDKNSGKFYYYNKKTRETVWTKPANYKPANAAPSPLPTTKTATAAPASASSALPEHWAQAVDPGTGQTYYYNKKTKETSWTAPTAPTDTVSGPTDATNSVVREVAASAMMGAAASGQGMAVESTADADLSRPGRRQRTGTISPDGNWEEIVDPSGKKYWYNKATKATAWVLPSSAKIPVNDPAASPLLNLNNQPDEKKEVVVKHKEDPEMERPSEKMLRLKQALNERDQQAVRTKASNNPEEEEEEDLTDEFEFRFAKHRHGWLARTFRMGEAFTEEKLLTFKKSMIKKALLKKNRDLDAEAVQAFKNVMSYMGDRKSSKTGMDHARKMLQNALDNPAGLRDEVYLQLCKQTTQNPRIASTMKGWELMNFCLATFPPSKTLRKFLEKYFKDESVKPENEQQIKTMAAEALNRLDKIVAYGQRKEVPSVAELDCVKSAKPVPIRINLVNGTFKTLHVDAYTFTRDVELMLVHKLNLSLTTPFALYEASSTEANAERILDPKERVLDVLAAWEKAPEEEEVKEVAPAAKAKAGQVLAQHEEKTKVIKGPQYNEFLYKAKLVLKTSDPDVMADPEAVNLLYLQAIHDVVTARYPVKETDYPVLAALQLQATFGDFQVEAHGPGWLMPKLQEYMPPETLNDKKGKRNEVACKKWEQLILEKYSKITGFTSLEAKLNYLDYVQDWKFYGATFFVVDQRQFKDYPSPLTMGVTCEGVILMHPQKKVMLEDYPYTEIVTWGHSDDKFIIVVGNIVQQRKLIFRTKVGKAINGLVHDYVKFKVKNQAMQNPNQGGGATDDS